jgi:predicted chitinase
MEEDTKYFTTLTPAKLATIKMIVAKMIAQGLTNKYIQAAVLAVASKESNFEMREELGYGKTSAARIKAVFPTAFSKKTDAEVDAIKVNEKAFFDLLYGGKYGNAPDEGYKYRGRGFNQLTFKGNYKHYGEMIKVDLVAKPELVSTPEVAAAVLVAYFVDHLAKAPAVQKAAYNFSDENDFKSAKDAANAAYNANAGWGKSPEKCSQDKTGGYKTTHARVNGFVKLLSQGA